MWKLNERLILISATLASGVWHGWPVCAVLLVLAAWRHGRPLFLMAVAAACWGSWATYQGMQARLPEALAGESVQARIEIKGLPKLQSGGPGSVQWSWTFTAELELDQPAPTWAGQHAVRLVWYGEGAPPGLQAGQLWHVRVVLERPRGLLNVGASDLERHALRRGWHATGRVRSGQRVADRPARLDQARAALSARLRAWLSPWPLAASLLPALVCGDRRYIDRALRQTLARTGTAHLVAISGLHISLVAMATWWLSRVGLSLFTLAGGGGQRVMAQWAWLPAALAALGYASLAGFSSPTLRALGMCMLALVGLLLRRPWPPFTLLCQTLVVLLVMDPMMALDRGLWMSLTAVTLLIALRRRGLAPWRIQAVLSLVPAPLAALWFGSWGSAAWLANLFLVPLFGLVLIPVALVGALMPGAAGLLELAGRILALIEPLWQALGRWPQVPVSGDVVATGLVAAAMAARLVPGWPVPAGALMLAGVLAVSPATQSRPGVGQMELVVFDVGQGQALVIRTRSSLIIFDTGPAWLTTDAGSAVLLPWIQRQPQSARMVIVSHGDRDHAGGWDGLAQALPTASVWSGEPGRVPGALPCRAGQQWYVDGVRLEVLWPAPGLNLAHSNNRSCVVRVVAANGSVLLTGDIEKPVEYWLAAQGNIRADLLQLPHHGSASSSSYTLLNAVQPAAAFASAGHGNHFGHPADTTRGRLLRRGLGLHVTGWHGMLVFSGRLGRSPPTRLREVDLPPWRERAPVVE